MSQGSKANKTGKVLENVVTSTLTAHGFEMVTSKDFDKQPGRYGKELLLRCIPYTTLYGTKGYTEFLLCSEKHNLKIRIECKWQQSSGSVDEKLPYLFLNAIESMPENDIIILIDGDGFREGAKEWLLSAAKSRKYIPTQNKEKVVQIMNTTEFLTWVNNVFDKQP